MVELLLENGAARTALHVTAEMSPDTQVYMSKLKGLSKENGYDGLHQVHISHAAHARAPASILSELVFFKDLLF